MKRVINGKPVNIPDAFIQNAKVNLDLNVEEAVALYMSDEGHDVAPEVVEMTAKAKAAGTGAKATGEKVTRKPPVRAPDDVKRGMIAALEDYIATFAGGENVEVTNPERMIAFAYKGDKYELTLTKKRPAKK